MSALLGMTTLSLWSLQGLVGDGRVIDGEGLIGQGEAKGLEMGSALAERFDVGDGLVPVPA